MISKWKTKKLKIKLNKIDKKIHLLQVEKLSIRILLDSQRRPKTKEVKQ